MPSQRRNTTAGERVDDACAGAERATVGRDLRTRPGGISVPHLAEPPIPTSVARSVSMVVTAAAALPVVTTSGAGSVSVGRVAADRSRVVPCLAVGARE